MLTLETTFEQQVETLLRKDLPRRAGLSQDAFLSHVLPLADRVPDAPFVLVVTDALVPRTEAVAALELRGRAGYTSMGADELAAFRPTEHAPVPDAPAYLLVDVDLGVDTRGVSPDDALPRLLAAGRSPLTVDEGLAVVLQAPERLRTETCFEMLGSRCGDKRVTGLWVMKGGAPRLGWCWWGAPHDWLGAASCASRVG